MIPWPILVDTGPLVSLLSRQQPEHQLCTDVFAQLRLPLLTCLPVLTEAAYLLRAHPSQVRNLLAAANNGFLELLTIDGDDMPAINALLDKYKDQRFQFADACLMHLSEREAIDAVFTLDLRDFSVYRSPTGRSLELLPAATN
jgi:predicted nucleic acid-binding protein